MMVTSLGGYNYYVTFIDDHSWKTWIYFPKAKESEEVLSKFKEFKAQVENLLGRRIKILRSDNGSVTAATFSQNSKKFRDPHFNSVLLSFSVFAWFYWCLFKEYLYANVVLRLTLISYHAVKRCWDYESKMQLTTHPPLWRCSWKTVRSKVYLPPMHFIFIFLLSAALSEYCRNFFYSTVSAIADDVLRAPQWLCWFFSIPARFDSQDRSLVASAVVALEGISISI